MGTAKGVREKQLQKYQVIEELASEYPVVLLCRIAGVVRSSYYKWMNGKRNPSQKQIEDAALKEKILECHTRLKGIYGEYTG